MGSLSTASNVSSPAKQLGTATESSSAQSFASAAPRPSTTEPATDPAHLLTTTETVTDSARQPIPDALSAVPSTMTSTAPAAGSLPTTEPALSVPAVESVATEPTQAVPIAPVSMVPIPLASLQTGTLPTIPIVVPITGTDIPQTAQTVSTTQLPAAVPIASVSAATLPAIPVAISTANQDAPQLVPTTQLPATVPLASSLPATAAAVPETLAKPVSAIASSTATTTKTMRKREMIKLVRPMLAVAPECFPILVLLARKNATGTNIKPIIDLMLAAAGPRI